MTIPALGMRTFILAIAALLLAAQSPAFAERRVALVIGNSAYERVTPLINPLNDANAMTATLKSAGFDVVDSRRDLKAAEMRRALRDFVDKARGADLALVYYAGHGIEIDGTNYLLPVDAALERDVDAYDEAISLDRILTVMEPAKQLRLAILDACRDNPFNKKMQRTIGSRSVGRGLAKVEPNSPNTLIAFAAKAGSTASDGDSKNSPFTAALVTHLPKPGLDLRKAFGFVRDDVLKATSNKQEPFVYGSLGGNDVMLVPPVAVATPSAPAASATPAAGAPNDARRDYELALQVGTKAVWDAFVAANPSGLYTELAKAQRDKIASEAARIAATEKAKAAQEEQTRLAIEGAKKAEQDKAAAEARKAEQARVAAELAKRAEDAKLEAERTKAAAQAKSVEDAKAVAAKETIKEADKPIGPIAALAPDQTLPKAAAPVAVADIPKQLQAELRRVGCNTGAIGDTWTPAAQKSMELFNKNAGMKLDVKTASLDSLDAVRSKPSRICPLVCERGYQPDGERCSKIVCKAGFEVGDNNACEKIEVKKPAPPVAKRDDAPKRDEPVKPKAVESKSAAPSGQIICTNSGCRPVAKGCRIELNVGHISRGGQTEVCN